MDGKEKVIDIILDELKEIKKDVKDLVSFKYKLLGIVMTGSFIFTLVFTYLIK